MLRSQLMPVRLGPFYAPQPIRFTFFPLIVDVNFGALFEKFLPLLLHS
jgi:hypothetical protein